MTLCKFRPQRTYDAQFIVERHDAIGLVKMLGQAVHEMGEAGLSSTPYYVGAWLAMSTMFDCAERDGEVDKWTDFMRLFEAALEDLEGGDW